jgi:hypothetical protein
MKIGDAVAIYVGNQALSKVYAGNVEVWPLGQAYAPVFSRNFSGMDLGANAVYSGATPKYHQQPDGTWVEVPADQVRFHGAR